jgi:hypothetical protein
LNKSRKRNNDDDVVVVPWLGKGRLANPVETDDDGTARRSGDVGEIKAEHGGGVVMMNQHKAVNIAPPLAIMMISRDEKRKLKTRWSRQSEKSDGASSFFPGAPPLASCLLADKIISTTTWTTTMKSTNLLVTWTWMMTRLTLPTAIRPLPFLPLKSPTMTLPQFGMHRRLPRVVAVPRHHPNL